YATGTTAKPTKTNTLYIHVYAKFVDKSGSTQSGGKYFQYYKVSSWNNDRTPKTFALSSTSSTLTYYQLAKAGLQNYWKTNALGHYDKGATTNGGWYDFAKGVNFNTQVILHEPTTSAPFSKDQHYITITIGDPSSAGQYGSDGYWHFAYPPRYAGEYNSTQGGFAVDYDYSSNGSIHLATQYQTGTLNKGKYYYSPETASNGSASSDEPTMWSSIVGHELGHNLGLDDGYRVGSMYRTIFNKEIGPISTEKDNSDGKSYYTADNIMSDGTWKRKANSNDVEMALQAQGMSIKELDLSWQSYRSYSLSGWAYTKSKMIRLPNTKK
ncbi:MAG: hypothetical protein FWD65_06645, partial [Coriobacteriia bacterium]|nr:hypothetical protein [Coriobacteriia bacterium]